MLGLKEESQTGSRMDHRDSGSRYKFLGLLRSGSRELKESVMSNDQKAPLKTARYVKPQRVKLGKAVALLQGGPGGSDREGSRYNLRRY